MLKKHLRKQLDTIVYPQTNHTILYHDHSCFFWLAETHPLENLYLVLMLYTKACEGSDPTVLIFSAMVLLKSMLESLSTMRSLSSRGLKGVSGGVGLVLSLTMASDLWQS
jgi:hypothetical protein